MRPIREVPPDSGGTAQASAKHAANTTNTTTQEPQAMQRPETRAVDPAALAALETLRAPIRAMPHETKAKTRFRTGMLALAYQLEGLILDDDEDTLDAAILWTALHSFPTLATHGPSPDQLVSLVVSGRLTDEETVATLRLLAKVRRLLELHEPAGFTAAMWRSTLLAIYSMIELFVVLDDQRGIDLCFRLLDTADEIAETVARASSSHNDACLEQAA
ncbi:MAG: hypothetical protein AAF560_17940 [Acidobacteriota bacterium]